MRRSERKATARPEGRFARLARQTSEIKDDPRRIFPLARAALVDIWRSRGGGFYGLGYLLAFFYFEIQMLVGDVADADGAGSFALGQAIEWIVRISFLSFINVFQALLWPAYVLQLGSGVGIIVLVGAYLGFEYALKPVVEAAFPELREHRESVQARKASKKTRRDKASQNPDQ